MVGFKSTINLVISTCYFYLLFLLVISTWILFLLSFSASDLIEFFVLPFIISFYYLFNVYNIPI